MEGRRRVARGVMTLQPGLEKHIETERVGGENEIAGLPSESAIMTLCI